MGDRPVFEASKVYESPGLTPQTMTKKGMPVGGMGTGSMMLNLCGSFGPFHMKPTAYEERFLSQAAFHIREACGDETVAYTLATEDVLPAWNKLKPGDARYAALFPKAVFDFGMFRNAQISLLQFSPVIANNYKETSYPIGMFLFKARNTQDKPVKLSFMFTFPNTYQVVPASKDADPGMVSFRPERKGLSNAFVKQGDYTGIVMTAHDPENVPETQDSSWCIATKSDEGESVTYIPDWEGEGEDAGAALWKEFSEKGALAYASSSEVSIPSDKPSALPCGALCVSVELKPGEEKIIPFALTWNFPEFQSWSGTRWWKRYTEYFPAQGMASDKQATPPAPAQDQAFAIAREGLSDYPEWLRKVDAWTLPIAENQKVPSWLRAGALNELYYNVFGGSLWENGCINDVKRYGDRPGAHVCTVMECVAYPYMESFDVRHHPARVTRDLWPKNERDILLCFSDFIKTNTWGAGPHDLGTRNPLNEPDAYSRDYKRSKGMETTPWSEFSPKFILQTYMYWKQYKDDAFLDEVWASIMRSYYYQVTTDNNEDGITEMRSSEYVDNKLLNAILWIAALEALQEMAEYRKDEHALAEARWQLSKARPNTEKQMWNERLGYYQFNPKDTHLMADAFAGQRCADSFGLSPTVDEGRLVSHLKQCFERLVKPLKDIDGDGVGDMGAANIMNEHGQPAEGSNEHNHHREVWTGVTYNLAASMYYWGKRKGDESLKQAGLLTGRGAYLQSWEVEDNGFWFQTPEAIWFEDMPKSRGHMYQRVRGLWELYREVAQE